MTPTSRPGALRPVAGAVAAMLLLCACGAAPGPSSTQSTSHAATTAPDLQSVYGYRWLARKVSKGDQAGALPKAYVEITRSSTKGFDGVNAFGAGSKIEGTALTLTEPLTIGAAGCADSQICAFSTILTETIEGRPTIELVGGRLTLTSGEKKVEFSSS